MPASSSMMPAAPPFGSVTEGTVKSHCCVTARKPLAVAVTIMSWSPA